MAVYDDLAAEEQIRILDKGVCPPPEGDDLTQPPMSYRYGDIVVPFVSPDEPLAVQDRHFVECIATAARPLTDGQDGLSVVEALEAAELSRELGRPVRLEETRPGPRGHPAGSSSPPRPAASGAPLLTASRPKGR